MIPKECKRLAEVDFPIAAVSIHSAREKTIRHGHPSTLHLWWARRPLAACRAVLMALLLPDPLDEHCPKAFKEDARKILLAFSARPTSWDKKIKTDEGLRQVLLHEFIADFADWDNAANPQFIKTARALVRVAHGSEAPLVVDPFAGGGSIPLEALRIGCDAFASDLNPVACLINRVLLEDIPRHGSTLVDDFRQVGAEIQKQVEKELAEFYPLDDPDEDGNSARPIAYLWARTVRCEQPNCGCEIPLMRSFWLAKKSNRRKALRYNIIRASHATPRIEFEVFEPAVDNEVPKATVARAKATCPACHRQLNADRVRSQLKGQAGGADTQFDTKGHRTGGAQLLAVVLLKFGEIGRRYRAATEMDYRTIWKTQKRIRTILDSWKTSGDRGPCPVPDEPTPVGGGRGAGRAFGIQPYGMMTWGDLFTSRQKLALNVFAKKIQSVMKTKQDAKSQAVCELLGLTLSKLAELANSICPWEANAECPRHIYSRQAISVAWDFGEGVLTSESSGSFAVTLENTANGAMSVPGGFSPANVQQADACEPPLPEDSVSCWFSDPPYYDAIPYSDLSDFFVVWLRRTIPDHYLLRNPYEPGNSLAPKIREIVQDETKNDDGGRPKDRAFFEDRMSVAFAAARRVLRDDGIGSVVFAHKTTEGWEALLTGMIRGGWVITGSWPITTEMRSRLRARESAALAASVHLICRPRDDNAGIGDWGEIIRELPKKIADWMVRLEGEGIRGADLVFACIGPALEMFSKYSRVEMPDGEEISLAANDDARGEPSRRGFLSYVWEVAGRTALNQVLGSAESKAKYGAAGALEEDARLTALFLWTLQATDAKAAAKLADREVEEDDAEVDEVEDEEDGSSGGAKKKGLTMIYDVARRFAQPLGIHLDAWEGRIIETTKGVVRLLPVGERAKQLFGEEGASAVVRKFEAAKKPNPQMMLDFVAEQRAAAPELKGGRRRAGASAEGLQTRKEATTLDRVHAAMLLQSSGASNALRALLQAEVQRGPDFLRLANALSALYPRDSEEKRLLDAMLLAVPR